MKNNQTLLGIDIGTSKVAAVIIDTQRQLHAVSSKAHQAQRKARPGHDEQDADILLSAAYSAICELPPTLRAKVQAVGITGQMHGVVVLDENIQPVTPLITWEDARCLQGDFLEQLCHRTGHNIKSGFGSATIAWLVANDLLPASAKACATIHDLLAAKLCGLDKPVIDPTDAASWGLFDLQTLNWDFDAAKTAGLPIDILPELVLCGSKVGRVCGDIAERLGLANGVPVAAAIGDNQASILAALEDPEHELVLTLGTGGQLSAVLPAGHKPDHLEHDSKYEYRPFPDSRYVVVAAALCGGFAWEWLSCTTKKWLEELNFIPPPTETLYKKFNDLGLRAKKSVEVHPHFLGERYDTSLTGSISGINLNNFDLGTLSRGLARGIIENLKGMLPDYSFKDRNRIIGSGNALRLNRLLQVMAEVVFNLPLSLCQLQEEAACGAALNAVSLILQ